MCSYFFNFSFIPNYFPDFPLLLIFYSILFCIIVIHISRQLHLNEFFPFIFNLPFSFILPNILNFLRIPFFFFTVSPLLFIIFSYLTASPSFLKHFFAFFFYVFVSYFLTFLSFYFIFRPTFLRILFSLSAYLPSLHSLFASIH